MRKLGGGMVLACLVAASTARAQLGLSEAACRERWGEPVTDGGVTNGVATLLFANDRGFIEIGFVDGIARHVAHRRVFGKDERAVNDILKANAEGGEWSAWAPPGRTGTNAVERRWMRSDEMATACLDNGRLTITRGEWSRASVERPAAVSTNAAPAASPEALAIPAVKPPPRPLAGFWQSEDGAAPTVAMHLRADGTMAWIEYYERERREFRLRYVNESERESIVFNNVVARTADGPAQGVGFLRPETNGLLRFTAGTSLDEQPCFAVPGRVCESRVFRRVPDLPPWKPKPPSERPGKGDSRASALRMLGPPAGTMVFGRREVLTYPWGKVWLQDNAVVETE